MAQTSKAIRATYDKTTYKDYKLRVRKDSNLYPLLETCKSEAVSINGLVIGLLEDYLVEREKNA